MMKRSIFLIVLLLIRFEIYAQPPAQEVVFPHQIPLKVLYIGYSPEKPMPEKLVYYSTADSIYPGIYKKRMTDFKVFLEANFVKVGTVDARDYNAAMSDQYDVTIADAGPVHLPVNFDRPVILMAAMAPNIGIPIKLKMDWYCQCLDGEALNIKTEHEIFNSPFKVKLTMVNKPTPEMFFNDGYHGVNLPKDMLRWKVTEGYSTSSKGLIGMVSHGEGFDDSPDAEVISGGVCAKNDLAVALGRQGNYFMWGFAGSPDDMTEEAKKVFLNAICYIKKFDHQLPLVKKVQVTLRGDIDNKIFLIDSTEYKRIIIARKADIKRMKEMQQVLLDKKANGRTISNNDENFLKMHTDESVPSFEEYIKGNAGIDLFRLFGTNTSLYAKYYKDNYEYYFPSNEYALQLDEDAQKLGISNRQVAIIEKSVQLLEQHTDTALAQRILERYTAERFTTAAAWRNWLSVNRDRLFYTEAGGFKFMVNTYLAPKIPVKQVESEWPEKADLPVADAAEPVTLSAKLVGIAHKKQLVLHVSIIKGWHIYAYVPDNSPFIQSQAFLELPQGVKATADWQNPSGIPFAGNDGVFIYEGEVNFMTTIDTSKLKPGDTIKCGLYYQACDKNKCFPPTRKVVDIKIL